MQSKCRNIPNLYKPKYLEDKKDKEIIDHYIKLEGDNFIGKIGLGTSELVKWRAKAKVFKIIIDQARQYEVKKIIKRYEFEMKEKRGGFTNEYINTLHDLLHIKNQKEYLPLRLKMLKNRNMLFMTENNQSSRAKTIERIKNQFYITSYNHSRDKTRHKILDSIGTRSTTTHSEINKNSHSVKKRLNNVIQTIDNNKDNQNDYIDSRFEDNLIDPDRDNEDDNMKNEDFRVAKLKGENCFYTQPDNTHKKTYKKIKHNCISKNRQLEINTNESLEAKSASKKKFFHILEMRKRKERKECGIEKKSFKCYTSNQSNY